MESRQYDKRTPYEKYCDLPEDIRCELINDEIVMMASPSDEHQRICIALSSLLWLYLRGKRCQVRYEPGLRFREEEPINNALRPDIAVTCDPNKFRKGGIVGAPDFIIEVTSPSTASHDFNWKQNRYLAEGVREYWIINPEWRIVSTYLLDNGRYYTKTYGGEDHVPVSILEDCVIDMGEVFGPAVAEPQPEEIR